MDVIVEGHKTYAATGIRAAQIGEPVIILIHGAGMDQTVWELQIEKISDMKKRVLAVDLPGHGRSAGTPKQTIGEMADWICGFMGSLEIGSASLIGHSMGALVALEAASRQPKLIEKLVLMGVGAPMLVHPFILAAAQGQEPASPAPNTLANDLSICNDYAEGLEAAAKIQCRTLFILGRGDMMIPAKRGMAMAEKIKNSQTVIIERCGHMMMSEEPDQVFDAFERVLL